jgi:tetratricopeptide (TPR) repeat protein
MKIVSGLLFMVIISGMWMPAFPEPAAAGNIHYSLGLKYKADKEYEKAIEEFRKDIADCPQDFNVYLQIAEIRSLQGNARLAIADLNQAVAANPLWGRAHRMLAAAYEDGGELSKAVREYQFYRQLCDSAEGESVLPDLARLAAKIGRSPSGDSIGKAGPPPAAIPHPVQTAVPRPAVAASTKNGGTAAQSAKQLGHAKSIAAAPIPEKTAVQPNRDSSADPGPLCRTIEVRIDSQLALVTVDTLSDAGQTLLTGIHEFQNGDYDGALAEFKSASARYASGSIGAQCVYDIGVCYYRLHLFPEAENQFQQVLSRFSHDSLASRSLFLKAMTYGERRDPSTAELLLREFLTNYRNHPWKAIAWMRLGDAYMTLEQPARAIDAYLKVPASTSDCGEVSGAWYKIGTAYAAIGNPGRACSGLDSAIAIGEQCNAACVPQACYCLGDEKYKAKEYEQALSRYLQVVYKYPGFRETPWGLFQIGNIHRAMRHYAEAVEWYNGLIKRFPGTYWAKQAKWKLDDTAWEQEYLTTSR